MHLACPSAQVCARPPSSYSGGIRGGHRSQPSFFLQLRQALAFKKDKKSTLVALETVCKLAVHLVSCPPFFCCIPPQRTRAVLKIGQKHRKTKNQTSKGPVRAMPPACWWHCPRQDHHSRDVAKCDRVKLITGNNKSTRRFSWTREAGPDTSNQTPFPSAGYLSEKISLGTNTWGVEKNGTNPTDDEGPRQCHTTKVFQLVRHCTRLSAIILSVTTSNRARRAFRFQKKMGGP